jgi:ectoine hydroxylase-related dioxygenase (phytanoyl-CoA dioxygenase family)
MVTPVYKYEEYRAETGKQLRDTLDKYGIAIVPDVLDQSECKKMLKGMMDDVEHITQDFDVPFNFEDSSTWNSWLKTLPMHSMLQQHWKLGHTQTVWDVRQNPKVIKPFEDIWGVDKKDLLCSFDGITLHFPPEVTNRGWYRNAWLHTDQSFARPDFECVQSWVTPLGVQEGDGTLTYLRGSHLYHGQTGEEFKISNKKDWMKLDQGMIDYYTKNLGCVQECVKCPAGSMVLWDSRLIHCGREPTKGRVNPAIRCVSYICMTPRPRATESNLKKKRKAFDELRLTSHWPHKPKLFGKYPQLYGKPIPLIRDIPPPTLTSVGRRLAGFDE